MSRNIFTQSFKYLSIILNKIQKKHALNLLLVMFFGFVCVRKMKLTCKLYETWEANEEKGVFSYQFWLGL